MGPQKQLVSVAFAGGLDTKTDPKQVLPGKLLAAQNLVFQQTGAIARRWGYTALGKGILGTSAMIAACAAVNAFNDELLLYDGQQAYSYIEANDAWAQRGSIVSVIQQNQQIVRNDHQQLSPDLGALGGVEVYAWEDSRGGIRYSVFDAASGTIILADQPLYAATTSSDIRPKVIAWQGALYIFFTTNPAVGTTGTLSFCSINPASPGAITAPSVLIGQVLSPALYDVVASATLLCVSYSVLPAADTNIVVTYFTTALSIANSVIAKTFFSSTVFSPLANVIDPDDGSFLVFYPAANTLQASQFNSNGQFIGGFGSIFTGLALPIVAIGVGFVARFVFQIFIELQAASAQNEQVQTRTYNLSGGVAGPVTVFRGLGLASKPFSVGGVTYWNAAFSSNLQATYFTLTAAGQVVAKVNAGLGGGLVAASDSMLPEAAQVTTGVFKYANLVKGQPNTEAGGILALLGVNATKLDFADSNHFLSEAINGGFYSVGGILQSYDGAQYVESGFHIYPEGVTTSTSSSGGLLGTGTYDYAVTYEWTDNTGAVLPSTPSPIVSVTFGGGSTNSVTLTVPTLRLTKKSGVRIVIYRTTANGTLLYRVTSAILPLYNDPTVDTLNFIDTLADASITSNGLMYTQPLTTGSNPVLPNDAPPACSLIAAFDDRLVLGGLDDGYTLLPSQQSLANVPMQFSLALALRVDPDGGRITALARMDDKLVIFKESAIFYLAGTGPDATGSNSQWGDPVGVPSGGVGCANPNTVVLTPIGLLFQSANGIYLLDRGLNVSYKGAPVEQFTSPLGQKLAIDSATLVPNQWVIFTTAAGTALVYDFFYDQWSTFTNHAAVDSDLYLGGGNTFVWAKSDGTVYEQTVAAFSDAGQPIPFSLTTAWMNPGTIQGYQRVYHAFLLGAYKGSHSLNVWCGFDYDDALTALAAIPVDTALGISAFGSASPFGSDSPFGGSAPGDAVYQFRVDILRKCQAIRFQISDLESAPGNEGFSLSALTLVIGVKAGGNKVRSLKQFGAA